MHVENAHGTTIESCDFPAAGGNALLLNGHVLNTSILDSTFTRSGPGPARGESVSLSLGADI